MSATNRGRTRNESDHYATPEWCTEALFDAADPLLRPNIMDPFAGDGAILRVALRRGWTADALEAIELRESEREHLMGLLPTSRVTIGDAFTADFGAWKGRTIITNPPYSLAEESVRLCCRNASSVWMLLRLNFWGGIKRRGLFEAYPPAFCFVLPRRPSFTGKGTDAAEYAWFGWDRHSTSGCTIRRLEVTR